MTDPDDLALAQELWTHLNAQYSGPAGEQLWNCPEVVWGLFATPESVVGALGEVGGQVVAELGCGPAYVSAWLARRGARVVGLDLTRAQLRTAQAAQRDHGPEFGLVQANAEQLPLRDRSVDLVVSEHGAPAWCEPRAWVAEAARVLRPGGRLVFLTNSPLSAMCVPSDGGPAGRTLLRGPEDLRDVRWPGGGVEHHPGHGQWIALLTEHGFAVDALHELRAPDDADPAAAQFYGIADLEWARRWPIEDLWVAHLATDVRAR